MSPRLSRIARWNGSICLQQRGSESGPGSWFRVTAGNISPIWLRLPSFRFPVLHNLESSPDLHRKCSISKWCVWDGIPFSLVLKKIEQRIKNTVPSIPFHSSCRSDGWYCNPSGGFLYWLDWSWTWESMHFSPHLWLVYWMRLAEWDQAFPYQFPFCLDGH